LNASNTQRCATCYGEGTVGGQHGPEPCADCHGLGSLPSATVLTERRLRELERTYERRGDAAERDVKWLASEVRRTHHALMQILAASQDAEEGDELAAQIRGLANSVLGLYG
jgi:hypothetical protein